MIYINHKISIVKKFPTYLKISIVLLIDLFLSILATVLAFYLRLGNLSIEGYNISFAIFIASLISLPMMYYCGLYNSLFRYLSIYSFKSMLKAIIIYGFFYSILITFFGVFQIPRTIGIIQPIIFCILIIVSRILLKTILDIGLPEVTQKENYKRTLIYGAGRAGLLTAEQLLTNKNFDLVGFVDDDRKKQNRVVNGLKIFHSNEIENIIEEENISLIILAVPNQTNETRNNIINKLEKSKVEVKKLPNLNNMLLEDIKINDVRELELDDLLGRNIVNPIFSLMEKNIKDKIIMITGAGGSIGTELTRQISYIKPKVLLLLDINEYSLFSIIREIQENQKTKKIRIYPILLSVQDKSSLENIFLTWKPDTIYHAAAYKHVPLVEYNSISGIKNNIFGTLNLCGLAIKYNIKNFVLISTDKAVRPTNLMGATKRIAEMILQYNALNKKNKTCFSMVRFGNVIGSSGSVVPRFNQQIKKKQAITLTHKEITRYFMTTLEACQLVIQSSSLASGGDVFLLDMGKPIKIWDLAIKMIHLSGLKVKNKNNPKGDIKIDIIGLRSGEKLYEELLIGNNPKETIHPKIFKANEFVDKKLNFFREIDKLEETIKDNNILETEKIIKSLLPEYNIQNNLSSYKKINELSKIDL
jgi:FlaA1/EpsC-like NDP-sugar epimerase